ncbi:MAG TPA: hypothetical protein VEW48_05710 [Thermoanaerobaculia bacterium]|nr:hypothetical protein [Thermoanaerobaculia bacterium]
MGLTNQTETEIDVKQAVQAAKEFAETLLEAEEISDLGLEAVERPDRKYWYITLGFHRSRSGKPVRPSGLITVTPPREREYKVLKVDARTGDVLEMQMFKDRR